MSFCHKLKFSNPNSLMFQTQIFETKIIHSLKYQRWEFVAKSPCLFSSDFSFAKNWEIDSNSNLQLFPSSFYNSSISPFLSYNTNHFKIVTSLRIFWYGKNENRNISEWNNENIAEYKYLRVEMGSRYIRVRYRRYGKGNMEL